MPRHSVRKSISKPFLPLARAFALPKPDRGISSENFHAHLGSNVNINGDQKTTKAEPPKLDDGSCICDGRRSKEATSERADQKEDLLHPAASPVPNSRILPRPVSSSASQAPLARKTSSPALLSALPSSGDLLSETDKKGRGRRSKSISSIPSSSNLAMLQPSSGYANSVEVVYNPGTKTALPRISEDEEGPSSPSSHQQAYKQLASQSSSGSFVRRSRRSASESEIPSSFSTSSKALFVLAEDDGETHKEWDNLPLERRDSELRILEKHGRGIESLPLRIQLSSSLSQKQPTLKRRKPSVAKTTTAAPLKESQHVPAQPARSTEQQGKRRVKRDRTSSWALGTSAIHFFSAGRARRASANETVDERSERPPRTRQTSLDPDGGHTHKKVGLQPDRHRDKQQLLQETDSADAIRAPDLTLHADSLLDTLPTQDSWATKLHAALNDSKGRVSPSASVSSARSLHILHAQSVSSSSASSALYSQPDDSGFGMLSDVEDAALAPTEVQENEGKEAKKGFHKLVLPPLSTISPMGSLRRRISCPELVQSLSARFESLALSAQAEAPSFAPVRVVEVQPGGTFTSSDTPNITDLVSDAVQCASASKAKGAAHERSFAHLNNGETSGESNDDPISQGYNIYKTETTAPHIDSRGTASASIPITPPRRSRRKRQATVSTVQTFATARTTFSIPALSVTSPKSAASKKAIQKEIGLRDRIGATGTVRSRSSTHAEGQQLWPPSTLLFASLMKNPSPVEAGGTVRSAASGTSAGQSSSTSAPSPAAASADTPIPSSFASTKFDTTRRRAVQPMPSASSLKSTSSVTSSNAPGPSVLLAPSGRSVRPIKHKKSVSFSSTITTSTFTRDSDAPQDTVCPRSSFGTINVHDVFGGDMQQGRAALQLVPRDLDRDLQVKPWMVVLPKKTLDKRKVGLRDWDRE